MGHGAQASLGARARGSQGRVGMGMDLRPRIAAEIVEALLDDLGFSNPDRHRVRARWTELALSKITSRSVRFPEGEDSISTDHPAVVEAFLDKYPSIRPVLAEVRAKAEELEPGVEVTLEVMNDPEGCHTCYEGQQLNCHVLFAMDKVLGLDDPVWRQKSEALEDWWVEHPRAFGPDRDHAIGLFHLSARWTRDADT